MSQNVAVIKVCGAPGLTPQFLRTLKGSPCPGMMTSAVCSAFCRLTSCTAVFTLRSRQLSSSVQHSNKSPATSTVPAEVPVTWTLTCCSVWPGLGTTHTWGERRHRQGGETYRTTAHSLTLLLFDQFSNINQSTYYMNQHIFIPAPLHCITVFKCHCCLYMFKHFIIVLYIYLYMCIVDYSICFTCYNCIDMVLGVCLFLFKTYYV